MKDLVFRKLHANEIEVRIGATTKKTYSLLLYKDARVDMALLDEVVGVGNWQREHKILGNDIYCRVGIWDNDKSQWVWKEDAGSSGSIEVEKSKASDSFKRACVNLGIGRELYTSPEIKIWKKDENDDSYKYEHYFVKEIGYTNNEISKLIICEEKSGEVIFSYPKGAKVAQTSQKPQKNENENSNAPLDEEDRVFLQDYVGKLEPEPYNNFFDWLEKSCGTRKIAELNKAQGKKVVGILKNRKR